MDKINAAFDALSEMKTEVDETEEEEEVKKDIPKMMDEELSPITKRLGDIEKNTDLRISDILKLHVSDIRDHHIVLREQKTGKQKRIGITP